MFFKETENRYIIGIGIGAGGEEITKQEYDAIMSVIRSRPTAPHGYFYRLREDLTWDLEELPDVPVEDEESTESDLEDALKRLGV